MRRTLSSRRRFLGRAGAAAAAAFAVPSIQAWGALPPSDRIRIAHVGVGGRGTSLLQQSLGTRDVEVAAVCDVDAQHLEGARQAAGGKAAGFADYRKILPMADIDAVVVAAPDHWHAPIAIDACEAGKDVYVEKPLCTHLEEGRALVQAARRNKRMVQVGINHRSEEYVRRIVEIVRSGRIGKVDRVVNWMWENPVKARSAPSAPPPSLDFEMWLGPAPRVSYHPDRVHFNFRWCRDYAGGYMTDWGVHMLNVITFAMDIDHKGPDRIAATGEFAPDNLYDFPLRMKARWQFTDPDLLLEWIQPSEGGEVLPGEKYGMTFYGEQGQLRTGFGSHKFYRDGKEAELPESGRTAEVPRSPGHFRNWLDSMRSRTLPLADVEVGHRTTSLCQLGNIALFTGRELRWDWRRERFVDDSEADRYLSNAYREPYEQRFARA